MKTETRAEIEKRAKSHVSDMNNFPDTYTGSAVKASMLKSYIAGATSFAADREKLIECLKDLSERAAKAQKILRESKDNNRGAWNVLDTEEAQHLLNTLKK